MMNIKQQLFGKLPDGELVCLYTLSNRAGVSATINTFGGSLVGMMVPNAHGEVSDVVLGYDNLGQYLTNPHYFGAFVGRNTNRIFPNNIMINNVEYQLPMNDGKFNLHGGPQGATFRRFHATTELHQDRAILILHKVIPHLSDGFPGDLEVKISYTLTEKSELTIEYHIVSSQATVINFSNHSYFNLAGHESNTLEHHSLQLESSFYTPVTEEGVPTGEILSVQGTSFDFSTPVLLDEVLRKNNREIEQFGGLDHNFMLDGTGYRKVATLYDSQSGRKMETYTDQPCLQVYTANKLHEPEGKHGASYGKHSGLCLETQNCPNAIHMPWLKSPIYNPGEEYRSITTYNFSW